MDIGHLLIFSRAVSHDAPRMSDDPSAKSPSNGSPDGLARIRDYPVSRIQEYPDRLRDDHALRPLWVGSKGQIFLETFSPLYQQARSFLTAISEPRSRPRWIQEYRITRYSLYTAVSLGLVPEGIIRVLDRLCKNEIPQELISLIHSNSMRYGQVKIALRRERHFLEVEDKGALDMLLGDQTVSAALLSPDGMPPEADRVVECYEIKKEHIDKLRARCSDLGLPAFEEYDFKLSDGAPSAQIELKNSVRLRPYQKTSLSKMFGSGRARSGVIVLPCGAGKTLVGVAAAATIKKNCLVVCTSGVSIHQWASEFFSWSNIRLSQLAKFTSDSREEIGRDTSVVITTYSMMAYAGKRSYEAQKMMDYVCSREWGLLILDEAHVIPADMFRKVLTIVKAHTKLGLTATFVREDKRIESLNYLIGPKLYEADWLSLANQGYIAKAQCAEVMCPMTKEFYREYLHGSTRQRQMLYVMNPYKIQTCQYLIRRHAEKGDKTIVFSDNIFALKHYAERFSLPYIYGGTSNSERMRVLQNFRYNPAVTTVFISKIGDTSIDLPEASCLIQISSHYGSRRQEAQRLGRILRTTAGNQQSRDAHFYTLVSRDTEEVYYSLNRRKFLMNQGYAIKVIASVDCGDPSFIPVYDTLREQLDLLNTVLVLSESASDREVCEFEGDDRGHSTSAYESAGDSSSSSDSAMSDLKLVTTKSSTLQSFSGGDSMAYMEFNKGTTSNLDAVQNLDYHSMRSGKRLKR